MKNFIISLLDRLLEQNIYFVGSLGLGVLITFLIISIIVLVLTFKKSKTVGKIFKAIFILILTPETLYAFYWFTVFLGMATEKIDTLPL